MTADPSQRWWKRGFAAFAGVAFGCGAYAWATGTPPQNVALYVGVSGAAAIFALFCRGEERGWE